MTRGELDCRCTVDHGHAGFAALPRRGIPSKLLVFPHEGHWISKPKNAKAFHDVVFAWLAEHLGHSAGAPATTP